MLVTITSSAKTPTKELAENSANYKFQDTKPMKLPRLVSKDLVFFVAWLNDGLEEEALLRIGLFVVDFCLGWAWDKDKPEDNIKGKGKLQQILCKRNKIPRSPQTH